MKTMRSIFFALGSGRWAAAVLLAISCSVLEASQALAASPTRSAAQSHLKVDVRKFKLEGDPTSTKGARWTYESMDNGVQYKLNGTLFKPAGKGLFPAVLISHGQGSSQLLQTKISAEMVKWGRFASAELYFRRRGQGRRSPRRGRQGCCNPTDNLKRAHKCLDILAPRLCGHA